MTKTTYSKTASKLFCLMSGSLVGLTFLSAFVLLADRVIATDNDTSVDNIAITVQTACTMSGNGMSSHNKEIVNGTYENNIGTTTLKVICNDNEGFAIYAIGFTGDSYTGTNHTKLVGASTNQTIATGTATSSASSVTLNSSDISNWAMKLTATTGTYTPIIVGSTQDSEKDSSTPNFSDYASVPDVFTRVAYRNSGTDSGTSAEGSTLTTTYAAYINGTQTADTYAGKVKYTLVHPSDEAPTSPQATDLVRFATIQTVVMW